MREGNRSADHLANKRLEEPYGYKEVIHPSPNLVIHLLGDVSGLHYPI